MNSNLTPKKGVILSQSAKYKILVNEKNITLTIPVSVEYRLLSDAEIAERKRKKEEAAAEKAAAEKPKPFEAGEQDKLLADLRSEDAERVQAAAQRLARVVRKNEPAEPIGRALIAAIDGPDPMLHKDIFKALNVWLVPEAKQAAIRALRGDKAPFVGKQALAILEKFKTPDFCSSRRCFTSGSP